MEERLERVTAVRCRGESVKVYYWYGAVCNMDESAFDRRAAMPMQGSAICSAAGARFLYVRVAVWGRYLSTRGVRDVTTWLLLWACG
jgi:hypothetical protein